MLRLLPPINKSNKRRKILFYTLLSMFILFLILFVFIFFVFFAKTNNKNDAEIFIYKGETFTQFADTLEYKNVIQKNNIPFRLLSIVFGIDKKIRTGHYVIKPNSFVFKMVRSIGNGEQVPIKVVINNVRTAEDLAKKLSQNLLISEKEILDHYNNLNYKNNNQIFFDILPDTYEFYWNASPETVFEKLKKTSQNWWEKREITLKEIGYSKQDVIILASIIQQETTKNDEKSIIAGVYINRLKKNMLLQADPTIKFAIGDFSIKRINFEHLKYDSPFNTYLYKGLPPVPICLPDISSIMSVLNYKKHYYLYFCAKDDFSGYHNFASTLEEHKNNARKYHKALNQRKVR